LVKRKYRYRVIAAYSDEYVYSGTKVTRSLLNDRRMSRITEKIREGPHLINRLRICLTYVYGSNIHMSWVDRIYFWIGRVLIGTKETCLGIGRSMECRHRNASRFSSIIH